MYVHVFAHGCLSVSVFDKKTRRDKGQYETDKGTEKLLSIK